MEMDVLRMLARKAGNINDDKSIPLWRTAALQAIRRGALYVLIPIGMIAVIVIISNLLTSLAYQQSGELMEVKSQTQQLQRENDELRVEISKLETPERIYTTATQRLGMVAPSRILYGNQTDQAAKGKRR
ncbi:cell division protein FtsL [uncultured Megasphaera sp.]|uniref:cell division protein FtsL n=1 Tax=uncultured Megasphaera sp. TaxID=165188 RepID=UPI0025FB4645|nr:cell division protein FtsL [uncultured Megasphaera sp.]